MKNIISLLCILFIVVFISMLIKVLIEIFRKKRRYKKGFKYKSKTIFFLIAYLALVVNAILMFQEKWKTLYDEYRTCVYLGVIALLIFILYFLITNWFTNNKLNVLLVSLIGIFGSIGYALIMLVIDTAIKGSIDYTNLSIFALAITTYVYAQKITRISMIEFANQQVLKFRKKLFY